MKRGFDIIPAGLPELILSAFCKKNFAGLYNNLQFRYMVPYAEVLIISHLAPFSRTGSSARSTKDKFSCGTGILPVHKSPIEKGAISKYNQT
jgi:hypothetical protein